MERIVVVKNESEILIILVVFDKDVKEKKAVIVVLKVLSS